MCARLSSVKKCVAFGQGHSYTATGTLVIRNLLLSKGTERMGRSATWMCRCAWMLVCARCACVSVCACAFGGQRAASGVIPQTSPTFFGETESLFAWTSLRMLGWLASEPVSISLVLGLQAHATMLILFKTGSEDYTHVLVLARQVFHQLGYLLCPVMLSFNTFNECKN